MTDKTDKIRERLKEADEYNKHFALEAVVEHCEDTAWTNCELFQRFILDIIANELDVESQ